MKYELLNGDCLELYKTIPIGSVDLILVDPPYGNMDTDGGRKLGINGWDKTLPTFDIFNLCNNILRKNGRAIIFSQEPYTHELISEAMPNLPFKYRGAWVKDNFANALGVNKNLVSFYEDILFFQKLNPVHDSEFTHPLRDYFKKVYEYLGVSKKEIINRVGQGADHTFRFNSSQFTLCTEPVYYKLIDSFRIDLMEGYKAYGALKAIDAPYRSGIVAKSNMLYPSTFNLWEGGKFKSNIFNYKKDYDGHHPTQKPVLLLEDLIKTFSNEGDTVLDFTMGSGSTGVACMNTSRNFIGIEQDENYFEIAKKRIEQAYNDNDLLA